MSIRRSGGILKVSPYDYFSLFMSVEIKELEPADDFLLFRPAIHGRSAIVGHF